MRAPVRRLDASQPKRSVWASAPAVALESVSVSNAVRGCPSVATLGLDATAAFVAVVAQNVAAVEHGQVAATASIAIATTGLLATHEMIDWLASGGVQGC